MSTHSSLGLARKYRPRSFAELAGQKHVSAILRRAIMRGNLPQQLLFSGGSGLGKTTVARIAAAAVLCSTPLDQRDQGDACMRCESCLDVWDTSRMHPDVIEFDAASHGSKDEIREIASKAQLASMRGGKKIYIIDEAHGLSGPGGQAFLKLLEEPPSHVIFMLATTDPGKMLETNRGRCTEFELIRPSDKDIFESLQRVAQGENWVVSESVARAVMLATSPALGMRGILMTLEKLSFLFQQGLEPTDEELASLLGAPTKTSLKLLVEYITSQQKSKALEELGHVRGFMKEELIRSSLIGVFRENFIETIQAGKPTKDAEYLLEVFLGLPHGSTWTELGVARAAEPLLDASREALLSQVERLEGRVAALQGSLRELSSTAPVQVPTPTLKTVSISEPGKPAADITPISTATSTSDADSATAKKTESAPTLVVAKASPQQSSKEVPKENAKIPVERSEEVVPSVDVSKEPPLAASVPVVASNTGSNMAPSGTPTIIPNLPGSSAQVPTGKPARKESVEEVFCKPLQRDLREALIKSDLRIENGVLYVLVAPVEWKVLAQSASALRARAKELNLRLKVDRVRSSN